MAPVLIGISLKMYFGFRQTLDWCLRVAALAEQHPELRDGSVRLVVLPSYPAIAAARDILRGTGVLVGAQNLWIADRGAYTGEVGGPFLAEMGCTHVEVGHAERRRLFGEDVAITAEKTVAALRSGLTPIVCLGEPLRAPAADAAADCVEEVSAFTAAAETAGQRGGIVVAYEPQWAIGATRPAPDEHIATVCTALGDRLRSATALPGSQVIYGGSAGPGLFRRLDGAVDGLFLGRFAHDPAAVEAVLDEASGR